MPGTDKRAEESLEESWQKSQTCTVNAYSSLLGFLPLEERAVPRELRSKALLQSKKSYWAYMKGSGISCSTLAFFSLKYKKWL